ncbi:MAG: DUF4238 domain-containing protein [Rhodobacteraceae bacterium]|nr:DUF4238 domain-containing protein [Paracoccaceae bacterium]
MAGRKQHFIPRRFLKAFVISDGNDKLWLYRRGLKKPVPVFRDDAAATRDFYSRPAIENAPTLDDLITEYETTLQYLVDDLRALHAGADIPTDTIAEVVAHLTTRTAYLREFVKTGAKEMISSIDKVIVRRQGF